MAGLAAIALAVRWVRNGYETYAVRAAPTSLCQKELELSPALCAEAGTAAELLRVFLQERHTAVRMDGGIGVLL